MEEGTQAWKLDLSECALLHGANFGAGHIFHVNLNGTQDALKKESRGLSQVAAGNPGFTRIVLVPGEFLIL